MRKETFQAKNKEEAIIEAKEALNASDEEIVIIEKEVKKTLFGKKCEIEVVLKEEINKELKNYLSNLLKIMDIDGEIEFHIKDDAPYYNIVSSKAILIGKNGRTIDAIKTLMQAHLNELLDNVYYRFTVDVNDYKQNRKMRLEKLAKYTAKNVAKTKIAASLEPMNSYERRIIHSTLANSKDVKTESFGEEPHRYVVISPKTEEK